MKNFLVTIKGHAKRHYPKVELDIQWAYLRAMTDGMEWTEYAVYEEDSRGVMHLHTTCKGKKAPYYKKLQTPGWSRHFKEYPTKDIKKVQKYLVKHNQSKESQLQLFWENELRWAGNMFTDEGVSPPVQQVQRPPSEEGGLGSGGTNLLYSELDHGVENKIPITYKELFS